MDNSKYSGDIIRTGYITTKEKEFFFKHCEAFVYPSIYEGFGLPVLEAMQRGAVVITSNISSLPEVSGNSALYLNDVFNIDELANLYSRCLNLKEEEKQLILEKGYEQVKKFSWNNCAKNTLELFEEMEKK